MVLLQFFGRLCASGADAAETYNKQIRREPPPEGALRTIEHASGAQDLAVSTLHRLLSGLTGTFIQRIEGLLDALRTPDVTGATYVAFFAVAEGDHAEEEAPLVLLQSACYLGEDSADHSAIHLPDQQQASLFKRMLQEKAPIHAILDRLPDTPINITTSATTRLPELPPSGLATVAAPNPREPRRMHVAAVPLLHGSKLTGALWLEKNAAGIRGGDSNGAQAEPLLSDPRALRSLGFACSMCMLGPEASNAAWLAAVVSRLGASDSMSALTANLCAAVAAHVRRRFVLDAVVTAALVPPGPEVPLALLLQPSAPAAMAATNGKSCMAGHSSHNLPNSSVHTGAGTDAARSGEERPVGSGGAKTFCRSPAAGAARSNSANVALFAQLQLGAAALMGQSPQEPNGFIAAAPKRRLRPVGTVPTNSVFRDPAALIQARFSLDLSPRSPSLGPTLSSRSIIVPLHQPQPQAHLTECSPFTAVAGTPTLHARAFPLHRTLLLAHLQQQHQQHQGQQKQQQQPMVNPGGLASAPAATAMSAGLGENATTATMQAISLPSATAVIEDTQLHVQNVHKPSSDVCMLMGLTRKTANGMLGGSGLAGGGHSGHSQPWASVNGMVGGGPSLAAGVTAGVTAGGTVAAGGVPQSLVLLAMYLGEGGAALGLYLCFPKRLPAPLLEAVRTSCQELIDKGLAPITRIRLKDTVIGPEYETLCNANPGSYAVIRSASFCGIQAPPAFSGAYMSTVTGSDLAVAAAGGEAAAAAGATPPELLSGELLTADMEVLLALQAQQAQVGERQHGATGQDLSARRASAGAIRRSTQERALAAASFIRRSITAAGATSPAARLAHNPSSPLSPRTTYGNLEKRTLTGSSFGPLVPATGGNGGVAGAAAVTGGGECVEPLNLSQLLQSNPNDLLAVSYQAAALRTGSSRSFAGLENVGGMGGGFAASIITVSGVDNAATARQQLDLLVSSIHATISTDPAAGGVSSSPLDDLDALELGDVLGQGGGGTVFKGKLGTLDVAVKLMELPKVDPTGDAAAAVQRKGAAAVAGGGAGIGPDGDPAVAAADKLCLNARREMLRNATELAVQSRVSHPNVVQIYATYNDVVMVSKRGLPGCPGSTYRLYPAVMNGAGPKDSGNSSKERRNVPCIAAAFELCDCGSLGSALAARTFPKTIYKERERDADGAIALRHHMVVDMKGVYMTLLDVALALRHLHSMHLVHRDVKPANLLLKSNPRDTRGFTVKLADFGFVLHLGETAEDGTRYAIADQACGTVTHMAPEALLAKAKIDASIDIFAFGILMWEMFSAGVRPYPRLQPDKIPRAVYRGARPSFSDEVPSAYRNLALACWSTDPHRRPRASDVVVLLNGLLQELE